MSIKKELGQFYSKNEELLVDFIDKITPEDLLIDPFAGELDLLKQFNNKYEAYDVVPMENCIVNDSLKTPPSYKGKFIITNPPYLALNKASTNLEIFNQYDTDDLYKAALLSFLPEGEQGIIIIPAGFWFNERNSEIRTKFLTQFVVENVTVFNKQMFSDTTYAVCSFYFKRKETDRQQIKFKLLGNNNTVKTIELEYGKFNNYSILSDVEMTLKKPKIKYKIGRYTVNNTAGVTNIFLRCLDTSEKIKAYFEEPYMGISTDRAFLTFTIHPNNFSKEEELKLIDLFNNTLNGLRELYQDSFLSNYRNDGRKRIGFNFAYKLMQHCIYLLERESE